MTSFDTTLTVINTASIQTYIFASNQLRENIGASHLAHLATTHWVEDALNELLSAPNRHNYQVQAAEKDRQRQTPLYTNTAIEALQKDGQLCAEVIYSGGGNALILFAGANHDKKAQEFVYQLSRRVLLEAPGLQIYAGHHAYLWQDADQSLHHLITTINQQVIQKQQSQAPTYLPQLSLGVNATCTSTGLPAHGPHPDPAQHGVDNDPPTPANRANRQVMAQWTATRQYKTPFYPPAHPYTYPFDATTRLRAIFNIEAKNFHWSDDLDELANLPDRDESYIAVVHADGNGMGKRMINLGRFFDSQPSIKNNPRAYITAVRALSESYRETAEYAFINTVNDLLASLIAYEGDDKIYYVRSKENKQRILPLRPIVFGGDDVTWVCAGPWGVPSAQRYLYYLEQQQLATAEQLLADLAEQDAYSTFVDELNQTLNLLDQKSGQPQPPYACAGVSIVKTHYPISRAYENSEELLKSAKAHVKLFQPDKNASAIDWHITTTGLSGNLEDIRQREYQTAELDQMRQQVETAQRRFQYRQHPTIQAASDTAYWSLTMRPIFLNEDYSWRHWGSFLAIWQSFQGWPNSKMIALREALRHGPETVSDLVRRDPNLGDLPIIIKYRDQLAHGWCQFPPDAFVTNSQNFDEAGNAYRTNQQKLAESACAYFDAIELQNHLIQLVDPQPNKEASVHE